MCFYVGEALLELDPFLVGQPILTCAESGGVEPTGGYAGRGIVGHCACSRPSLRRRPSSAAEAVRPSRELEQAKLGRRQA